MACDNALLAHICNGLGNGMTIIGDYRSLHQLQQYPDSVPLTSNKDGSQQTERRTTRKIDRQITTRDRDREYPRSRFSRNVDVRYLKSLQSLRDRLRSAYSCNQRKCPLIRERYEQHQVQHHQSGAIDLMQRPGPSSEDPTSPIQKYAQQIQKKCSLRKHSKSTLTSSKSSTPNGSGPYLKRRPSLQVKTRDYGSSLTSSLYNISIVNSVDITNTEKYRGNNTCDIGTQTDNIDDNSSEIIDQFRNVQSKYTEVPESINNRENLNDHGIFETDKNVDVQTSIITVESSYSNFMGSNLKVDGITSASYTRFKYDSYTQVNTEIGVVNRCKPCRIENFKDSQFNKIYNRLTSAKRNKTSKYDNIDRTSTKFHKKSNLNIIDNFNNMKTHIKSNISELEQYDVINSDQIAEKDKNNSNISSKPEETNDCSSIISVKNFEIPIKINSSYHGGNDRSSIHDDIDTTVSTKPNDHFSEHSMDNSRIATTINKGLHTASNFEIKQSQNEIHSTASYTFHAGETSNLQTTSNKSITCNINVCEFINDKSDKFFDVPSSSIDTYDWIPMDSNNNISFRKNHFTKNSHIKNRTRPSAIGESYMSISDSSISFKRKEKHKLSESRINYHGPVETEIREWIQEIPMYPGLGKEAKDDNEIALMNLIRNLNNLTQEADRIEYQQKIKNEIDTCLKQIPIWYPGCKNDEDRFKTNLIDRLFERLKIVIDKRIKRNAATNYNNIRKESKNTLTDQIYDQFSISNDIRKEILEWLWSICLKTKTSSGVINIMPQMADFVIDRLYPLLNKLKGTNGYRLHFKTAIVNIINELPVNINYPRSRHLHIAYFAEDLINKLINVQARYNYRNQNTLMASIYTKNNFGTEYDDDQTETLICWEIRKCLANANIPFNNLIIKEITIILLEFIEIPDFEREFRARDEIVNILIASTNISEARASGIARTVLKKVRNIMDDGKITNALIRNNRLKGSISVYTSIGDSLNYPLTSTPKKKPAKKSIPKLNSQELQYMEQVGNLIRSWMNTLPENFDDPEEQYFKETIIRDLAGDIMDEAKIEQLAPGSGRDKDKFLNFFVSRWLWRLEFDLQEVQPQVYDLLKKLKDIPVPIMTKPQYGSRQIMENLKHTQLEDWDETFVPTGRDILEDEISIWMNEQPSIIFVKNDKSFKQRKIQELAQVLESKLANHRPQVEIAKDVAEWLIVMVKPEEKGEIGELAEDLKDRIAHLPQDATLAAKYEEKQKEKAEVMDVIAREQQERDKANPPKIIIEHTTDETFDQEDTVKKFISQYIEHNYDIDDPLARRAYNYLLRTHLLNLNPPTRKDVYDNFAKGESDVRFLSRNLVRELEYIKDVSDWLKNLPVNASYNTVGNRVRIDFVNSLAQNIRVVEDEREKNPNAGDYDMYMASIIFHFLSHLPIPSEYDDINNFQFMMEQLAHKIAAHRQTVHNKTMLNESIDTTGINTDNIGDFVEEFIKIYGEDIAQDEIKIEAWAIRLIREIKKVIRETSRPSILSKTQVYKKLTKVSKPGDETVELFSLELQYINEITNWLKNLPLLPITTELEEHNRVKKICELAEKMAELDRQNIIHAKDIKINQDFKDYVEKWIAELPLDKKKDIVLPLVIQQLINRMEKTKRKEELPNIYLSQTNETMQTPSKPKQNKSKTEKARKKGREKQDSSNWIIDVIEKWSSSLPIQAENENALQNIRDNVSRDLFKKVGQLNLDPLVYNDELLYRDMLVDEIDTIFENLPQNVNLQSNKEKLKLDLLNGIIDATSDIKEKTAGDNYKLKLQNTIEASIPNPVTVYKTYDPGFEIYKGRLATMFILQNYDHGSDATKIKYEKLLKKEIDRYFEHANHKNIIPLSEDEIYNELYSALFKVPIPNEASIIEEVEEIKTRCEIDAWFEKLPLKEPDGINELLEWDKILSAMAKRIHEIETSDAKSDENIYNEIMKWLVKLPIQPGHETRISECAKTLIETLKSTATERKCVLDEQKSKGRKGKSKVKSNQATVKSKGNSQVAGPSNGKIWPSITHPLKKPRNPRKTAADNIYETVEAWCNQLPVSTQSLNEEETWKSSLTTKIIIKISELNMDTTIFEDDVYYDELLDKELEILLSSIPLGHDFEVSKEARKYQLKEAIKSIKPLIREERAKHNFKQNLNNTVDRILEKPTDISTDKEAIFNELRNDIIDEFIQSKFSNKDENQQLHRNNVQNAISKLVSNVVEERDMENKTPLMKTNQLLCELARVTPLYKISIDEVEEIRMKKEVNDFFESLSLWGKEIDRTKVNLLKESLAKKLNDIEMSGYTPENESKMKHEISRCLSKLDKVVNEEVIDAFIDKLKKSELVRRVSPVTSDKQETSMESQVCDEACKRICHTEIQDLGSSTNKRTNDFDTRKYFPTSASMNEVQNLDTRNENQHRRRRQFGDCKECRDSEEDSKERDSEEYRKTKCLCRRKRMRLRDGKPCYMMPKRWMYENCARYDPICCRMPLPGFF